MTYHLLPIAVVEFIAFLYIEIILRTENNL